MESIAHTWGSTAAERERAFPCDRHLLDADDAYFRAVDVDAPPAVVFRWLCQLRAAPYSYDWIDNFGRRSPRRLKPGLERLEVGQRVMTLFELVEFAPDGHLTVRSGGLTGAMRVAVTYEVSPRGDSGSRLLVKVLVRCPNAVVRWVVRSLLPWGDLVMMRRQLLNLKEFAEATAAQGAPV